MDYKKTYYEQQGPWLRKKAGQERLNKIVDVIPSDVQTVLDIGCGNGYLINFLLENKKYKKLVGLDISSKALRYIKTEKILGDIINLPFQEDSFDLIVCSEIIEHLTEEDFIKAISEVQRVSKKYILITVPNKEILEHSFVRCPDCHCCFNSDFHMRNFNKKKLEVLFDNFMPINIKELCPKARKCYSSFLMLIRLYCQNWKNPVNFPNINFICPQCHHQFVYKTNASLNIKYKKSIKHKIWNSFKFLRTIPWTWKNGSLIALYKKRD